MYPHRFGEFCDVLLREHPCNSLRTSRTRPKFPVNFLIWYVHAPIGSNHWEGEQTEEACCKPRTMFTRLCQLYRIQIFSVGPMNGEERGSDTKPIRPLTWAFNISTIAFSSSFSSCNTAISSRRRLLAALCRDHSVCETGGGLLTDFLDAASCFCAMDSRDSNVSTSCCCCLPQSQLKVR